GAARGMEEAWQGLVEKRERFGERTDRLESLAEPGKQPQVPGAGRAIAGDRSGGSQRRLLERPHVGMLWRVHGVDPSGNPGEEEFLGNTLRTILYRYPRERTRPKQRMAGSATAVDSPQTPAGCRAR